jgi:release factor glutamine methyltransferase
MAETETWTVGRLLKWTTDYLGKQGADSPRLDAEILLAEARGCRRIDLYAAFDEAADETTRTAYRELVRRRAEGTPVAYLVGRREFYSLSFRVTPDVLIPRPETEYVVMALLDAMKQHGRTDDPLAIADVGTGSGILAICAAKYLAGARVVAVDSSPAALAVAGANVREHGVADRVTLVESDLFAAVDAGLKFDAVVSNPPYVAESEFAALARDVREHEPRAALVAGTRGTEVIERLVPQAAERLAPGGFLILEVSPMIEGRVLEILRADGRFDVAATIKDQAGLPRVVRGVRV